MLYIYTAYMWLVITAVTLFFGSTVVLCIPLTRKDRYYRKWVSGWSRSIIRLSGVKVEVRGKDKLTPGVPCVFMSNHQSYFDVICLASALPHPQRFVAKRELAFIPIFGQALWATGHIVINRGRRDSSVSGLHKAARKIAGGTNILVFPEGTRSRDHRVGPLKKGGFVLAIEAQAPVVPVSVTGTSAMMPKGGITFKKSDVVISIGDPIPTAGLSYHDREELMAKTRAAIQAGFPEGTVEAQANR